MSDLIIMDAVPEGSTDDTATAGGCTGASRLLTHKELEEFEENSRTILYLTCESDGGLAVSLDAIKINIGKRKNTLYDDLSDIYQMFIDAVGDPDGKQKVRQLYLSEHPDATIKSNKHPMQLAAELVLPGNCKQANRYSRALRYALYKCVRQSDLKGFLENNSGIDECTERYSELTNGPKKKASRKTGLSIVCDAGTLDAIKAHVDSETKQARADVTFMKAEDGTLAVVSIEFWSD